MTLWQSPIRRAKIATLNEYKIDNDENEFKKKKKFSFNNKPLV